MFLKRLKGSVQTISLRLTLWFSFLFTAGTLLLFGLCYLQFRSHHLTLVQDLLKVHAEDAAAAYRQGGGKAVERLFNGESELNKRTYVLRVLNPDRRAVYVHLPDTWTSHDFSRLDHSSGEFQWIELANPHSEDPYEFAVLALPDHGLLQVGRSIEIQEREMNRLQRIFWTSILPILLLSYAAGAFMTTRVLQPIRELTASVQAILRTGKLNERVPLGHAHDELQQLVVLFNQMLEKNERLIQGMREALDSVAHDLRTPMTRFRGSAELALQTATCTAMQEALASGLEQSDQILQALDTLIDISEAETGAMRLKLTSFSLADLLRQVEEVYRYLAEEKRIVLTVACPDDLQIIGDRSRLGRVLANLMDNAIKYTPESGKVAVTADLLDSEISVTVKDTGIGIAQMELSRIWDRLYRIDPSRHERGLGLGLTLVKAIVQAHHGRITVHSQVGQGSTFTLHLPAR
jgi:signal transduction histidine kinase